MLIDLIPRDIVQKWLKYLRNEFPTVAFKASTQTQNHNLVSIAYIRHDICYSLVRVFISAMINLIKNLLSVLDQKC